MSNEDFPETDVPLHPINLGSYTLDTVPATEISVEEAQFWAETLSQTLRMEGTVIPMGNVLNPDAALTIGQLLQHTESTQRNRLLAGKTIVGPAVLNGVIERHGIGFWGSKEKESTKDV